MKKGVLILLIIGILVIIGLGIWILTNPSYQSSQNSQNSNPSGTASNPSSASSNQVIIKNFAFSPSELTINAGDKVTWINQDSASHTITSDSSEFNSNTIKSQESFSYTFTKAGEYSYHCSLHPSMKAKIIVK